MIRESLASPKKSSDVRKLYVSIVRRYSCYDVTSNNLKLSSNGLNKPVVEESGDVLLEKYRRVLNEKVNVNSNNRVFRTTNQSVATFRQIENVCPTFT